MTEDSPPADGDSQDYEEIFELALRRSWEAFYLFDPEELYREGNERILLDAVAAAAYLGKPAPEWAAKIFAQKVLDVSNHKFRNWDEAFGNPHPPRTNFNAIVKSQTIGHAVYRAITELRISGTPIDEAFEEIGKQYHVSASTARNYYYRFKRLADSLSK